MSGSTRSLIGSVQPLVRPHPDVCGAPDQSPGRTDGRGAGRAWFRLAYSAGRALTALSYPDPWGASGPMVFAPLGPAAVRRQPDQRPERLLGDGRGDALVHMALSTTLAAPY